MGEVAREGDGERVNVCKRDRERERCSGEKEVASEKDAHVRGGGGKVMVGREKGKEIHKQMDGSARVPLPDGWTMSVALATRRTLSPMWMHSSSISNFF